MPFSSQKLGTHSPRFSERCSNLPPLGARSSSQVAPAAFLKRFLEVAAVEVGLIHLCAWVKEKIPAVRVCRRKKNRPGSKLKRQ